MGNIKQSNICTTGVPGGMKKATTANTHFLKEVIVENFFTNLMKTTILLILKAQQIANRINKTMLFSTMNTLTYFSKLISLYMFKCISRYFALFLFPYANDTFP